MAASLVHAASSPLTSPSNPPARTVFHTFASSSFLRFVLSAPDRRRCRIDAPLRALSAGTRLAAVGDAPQARRVVAAFAGEEPLSSEPGDDKENGSVEIEPEEAQEVWREMLKQFKSQALQMQSMTTQAYVVYSNRAREVLMEASRKLSIQADKAQKDLSVIAAEVGEEGQEYLNLAAQNSPDSIKDIIKTIKELSKLKVSEYHDYHVGIPFGSFMPCSSRMGSISWNCIILVGAFLTVGGFLNFMLTGSVSAIRFGFVLGFALLAMGISSLRSQNAGGRQPRLLLKGQAAIASIIFIRELSFLFQYGWFPNIFVLLSGTVSAFYINRLVTGGHKGPSTKSSAE